MFLTLNANCVWSGFYTRFPYILLLSGLNWQPDTMTGLEDLAGFVDWRTWHSYRDRTEGLVLRENGICSQDDYTKLNPSMCYIRRKRSHPHFETESRGVYQSRPGLQVDSHIALLFTFLLLAFFSASPQQEMVAWKHGLAGCHFSRWKNTHPVTYRFYVHRCELSLT